MNVFENGWFDTSTVRAGSSPYWARFLVANGFFLSIVYSWNLFYPRDALGFLNKLAEWPMLLAWLETNGSFIMLAFIDFEDARKLSPSPAHHCHTAPADKRLVVDKLDLARPTVAWPTLLLSVVGLGLWFWGLCAHAAGELSMLQTVLIAFFGTYLCFTPMHDATHGAVVPGSRALNDAIGFAVSIPFSGYFQLFRLIHQTHHKHANDQVDDPDVFCARGPQILLPLRWALGFQYYGGYALRHKLGRGLQHVILFKLVFTTLLAASAGNTFVFGLLIPQLLASCALMYTFDYLPHRPHILPRKLDPFKASNVTFVWSEILTNALFLNQNLHAVHHNYPQIPWYRYSKLWSKHGQEMIRCGVRVIRTLWISDAKEVFDETKQAHKVRHYSLAHAGSTPNPGNPGDAIQRLTTTVIAAFDGPSIDGEELDSVLGTLGVARLKPQLLSRYRGAKVDEFVHEVEAAVRRNPILVALASEWDAQPDLCAALPPRCAQQRSEIRMAVAHCFALDGLAAIITDERIGDRSIFAQIEEVFAQKRAEQKWKQHVNTFEYLKFQSVQLPIRRGLALKRGRSARVKPLAGPLLSLNIFEAMCHDALRGFESNADCGYAMMREMVNQTEEPGLGNKLSCLGTREYEGRGVMTHTPALPVEWANLYISWNLAFCANHYENWPMFFAKLLNPCTGGRYQLSDPGTFMHHRALTLWLHLHWFMFSCTENGTRKVQGFDWRSPQLSKVWGDLNLQAANQYSERIHEIRTRHHASASLLGKAKRVVCALSWGVVRIGLSYSGWLSGLHNVICH